MTKLLIKLSVVIAIFLYLFKGLNISQFKEVLSRVEVTLLFAGFMTYLIAVLLQGQRLNMFMSYLGSTATKREVQYINFVSMFFDLFVPGRLGSDINRYLGLAKNHGKGIVIASLACQRIQGAVLTMLVGGLCLLVIVSSYSYLPESDIGRFVYYTSISFVWLIAGIFFVWLVILNRGRIGNLPVFGKLAELYDTFSQYRVALIGWIKTSFQYSIFLMSVVLLHYFVVSAYSVNIDFVSILLVVPIMLLAAMLPITMHGRGLVEIIALAFWHSNIVSKQEILTVTLTVYAIALIQGVMAGLIWLFDRKVVNKDA